MRSTFLGSVAALALVPLAAYAQAVKPPQALTTGAGGVPAQGAASSPADDEALDPSRPRRRAKDAQPQPAAPSTPAPAPAARVPAASRPVQEAPDAPTVPRPVQAAPEAPAIPRPVQAAPEARPTRDVEERPLRDPLERPPRDADGVATPGADKPTRKASDRPAKDVPDAARKREGTGNAKPPPGERASGDAERRRRPERSDRPVEDRDRSEARRPDRPDRPDRDVGNRFGGADPRDPGRPGDVGRPGPRFAPDGRAYGNGNADDGYDGDDVPARGAPSDPREGPPYPGVADGPDDGRGGPPVGGLESARPDGSAPGGRGGDAERTGRRDPRARAFGRLARGPRSDYPFAARAGNLLPPDVGFAPLPRGFAASFPEFVGDAYVVDADLVVIVEPYSRRIVAVLPLGEGLRGEAPSGAPVGRFPGRRDDAGPGPRDDEGYDRPYADLPGVPGRHYVVRDGRTYLVDPRTHGLVEVEGPR